MFDFVLPDGVLFVVRIIATVGGAVVGWFACDPLTRGLYRLSFRAAAPASILLGAKLSGAALASVLIWFFMPLGGGGGGLGWGPGLGGAPGKGPGQGGNKVVNNGSSQDIKDSKSNTPAKAQTQRKPLEIEILGGSRFKSDGEDRYYLPKLKDAESAHSLAELEKYFQQNKAKLLIVIVHTEDSAVFNTEEDPTRKLRKLATQYDIPTRGPKE